MDLLFKGTSVPEVPPKGYIWTKYRRHEARYFLLYTSNSHLKLHCIMMFLILFLLFLTAPLKPH